MRWRKHGIRHSGRWRQVLDETQKRCRSSLVGPSILAAFVALGSPIASADEFAQIIFTPHFSLANPGARSLGLGGAFAALADDATAAMANPAGLVQLARPEVAIEGRHWSYATPYTVSGNTEGIPTGFGLDTEVGLRTAVASGDSTGLSFVSLVYPFGRWSFALYRHLYLKFESSTMTQGLFGGEAPQRFRYFDQVTSADSLISSYGLSSAVRISDSFSLGMGLVLYETEGTMKGSVHYWDDRDNPAGSPTTFGPENLMTTAILTQDDQDLTLSGGFLWNFAPGWALGGKFREGPEVRTKGTGVYGPANYQGYPPGYVVEIEREAIAKYPDTYGLGVAFRSPDGRWTAAFEWDRVTYSDMPESLELSDQTVEDGDEIHLGGEYVFLGSKPLLALRAGAWRDPDHMMRATSDDPYTRALLWSLGDEMHYSAGFGMAFERFQLDGAIDFSELVDTISLSAIFTF